MQRIEHFFGLIEPHKNTKGVPQGSVLVLSTISVKLLKRDVFRSLVFK